MAAVINACIRDGSALDEELEVINALGQRLWVGTIGEAVRDASGKTACSVGVLKDLTAQNRVEQENQSLTPKTPRPRHCTPASKAALPPAAVVLTVTVCSAQKRYR